MERNFDCTWLQHGGKLSLKAKDLTEPQSTLQSYGYNGKLWHVYAPESRKALVGTRDLLPDIVTYADCLQRLMFIPSTAPRSEGLLLQRLKEIAAKGEVRVESGPNGVIDILAYEPWPGNEAGHAGYRISLDPAASFAIKQVDCFSARKKGSAYEQVQPYSSTRFSSFEQVAEGVSLPRVVSIDEYSQVTKERNPEVLKKRGYYMEPAEAFLTKRLEIHASAFHRQDEGDQLLFEPVFAIGTHIYDELSAASYFAGDPVKNIEKEIELYKRKK